MNTDLLSNCSSISRIFKAKIDFDYETRRLTDNIMGCCVNIGTNIEYFHMTAEAVQLFQQVFFRKPLLLMFFSKTPGKLISSLSLALFIHEINFYVILEWLHFYFESCN